MSARVKSLKNKLNNRIPYRMQSSRMRSLPRIYRK